MPRAASTAVLDLRCCSLQAPLGGPRELSRDLLKRDYAPEFGQVRLVLLKLRGATQENCRRVRMWEHGPRCGCRPAFGSERVVRGLILLRGELIRGLLD